jgi:hypothetical protein
MKARGQKSILVNSIKNAWLRGKGDIGQSDFDNQKEN